MTLSASDCMACEEMRCSVHTVGWIAAALAGAPHLAPNP